MLFRCVIVDADAIFVVYRRNDIFGRWKCFTIRFVGKIQYRVVVSAVNYTVLDPCSKDVNEGYTPIGASVKVSRDNSLGCGDSTNQRYGLVDYFGKPGFYKLGTYFPRTVTHAPTYPISSLHYCNLHTFSGQNIGASQS